MKNLTRYLGSLILTALMLTSCSKNHDSCLEVIPDDYDVVINVNLAKLTDAAGTSLDKIMDKDAREAMAKVGEGLDLNSMFIAFKSLTDIEDPSKVFIAVPVIKEGVLKQAFGSPSSKNGFDIYKLNETKSIAVKGKIAYLVVEEELNQALKVIDDAIEDCDDGESLAKMKGANEAFENADASMTVLVNADFLGKESKEHKGHPMWVIYLTLKDQNTIDFNGYSVYPDGERVKMEQPLANINPEVLQYAGANPNLTVAVGIPGNYNWKAAFRQFNEAIKEYNPGMVISDTDILAATQLLQNIDGTVFISFGLKGSIEDTVNSLLEDIFIAQCKPGTEGSLLNMNNFATQSQDVDLGLNGSIEDAVNRLPEYTMVAQCKPGTEGALLNMIKFAAQSKGVDLTLNPDLTPALNKFGPYSAYIGAIDGMVIISTKKPEKTNNNLVADLKGKQLGFVLNMPSLGSIMPALDTKINMTVVAEGNEMTGSFTCVDKPIFTVLGEFLGI